MILQKKVKKNMKLFCRIKKKLYLCIRNKNKT